MSNRCGNVVLVDDDPGFRAFLKHVLERAGYTTIDFATAEEAQQEIEERRPALLLTDVHLSGVSGYELCRHMKDTYGDEFAVMLISGERTEPFDRAAGILLGADDYLVKPVDPGELVARVWRLARRANGKPRAAQSGAEGGRLATLTAREREVLDLLTDGSDQAEIAEALFISPKTVATHIQRILTKLGVRSRTQAVALALRYERDVNGHVLAAESPLPPLVRPTA